jgi:hypothetical protein
MEPWNLFKAEKDHLELVQHSWVVDSAHKRVLRFVEGSGPSSSSGPTPMKMLKKEAPSPNHSKSFSSKTSKSNKKKYQ